MRQANHRTYPLLAGFLVVLSPAASLAQEMEIPNFSGFWTRSDDASGRSFQAPETGPGPIMRAADSGPFWIAELPNPILGEDALAAVAAHAEIGRSGNISQPAWVLCWPPGLPLIVNMNDPMQFLQTPDKVTIIYERDNQLRHIYLDDAHPDTPPRTWYGHSVGHYEGGDTLVVDTVGQNDIALVDRFGTPRSEELHVVERYTIAPDRSAITVELTIEDPEMFTTPWSARAIYWPAVPFHESICAENNKDPLGGTFDIPIASAPEF
jgi:hypothetical protein